MADKMSLLVKEIETILSAKQALVTAGIITEAEYAEMKKVQMARIDAVAAGVEEVVVKPAPHIPVERVRVPPPVAKAPPSRLVRVETVSPDNKIEYYNALQGIIEDFVSTRSVIGDVECGWMGIGGLSRLKIIYCDTSLNNCDMMGATKELWDFCAARCDRIENKIDRVRKTKDVSKLLSEFKDSFTELFDDDEIDAILKCKDATFKELVLGGKTGWVKKLFKSSRDLRLFSQTELEGYKAFRKAADTRVKTLMATYRYVDRFAVYVSDKHLSLGEVTPKHVNAIWNRIAKYTESKKLVSYEKKLADQKTLQERIKLVKRLSGCTLNQAKKCVLLPPELFPERYKAGLGSKKNIIAYISQFCEWVSGGGGERTRKTKKYMDYLYNPETGDTVNPISIMERPEGALKYETQKPYRISISENKYLRTSDDEIIKIYEKILAAHDRVGKKEEQRLRLRFILLRIIRESGGRPANVSLVRWSDIMTQLDPPKISWEYARKNALKGKNPPVTTYISHHLADDVEQYLKDYHPPPNSHIVTGLSKNAAMIVKRLLEMTKKANRITNETKAVGAAEDIEGRFEDLLSMSMRFLSDCTCPYEVLSIRLRRSLFTLVWRCYQGIDAIQDFTGDKYTTVERNYKERSHDIVDVNPRVIGEFKGDDMARYIFDHEYPTTKAVPERYRKMI